MTAAVQAAILALPKQAWTPAIEADGELRAGADVAEVTGWRFQTFATDTEVGQLAQLEARYRAHARVEDRIRCA